MPKVIDSAEYYEGTSTDTHVLSDNMELTSAIGDIIYLWCAIDNNATITTPTGWTAENTIVNTQGASSGLYSRVTTAANEALPDIVLSIARVADFRAVVLRGQAASSPTANVTQNTGSGDTPTWSAQTIGTAKSMSLYFCAMDADGPSFPPSTYPIGTDGDKGGVSASAGWTYEYASGTIASKVGIATAGDGWHCVSCEVLDNVSTPVAPPVYFQNFPVVALGYTKTDNHRTTYRNANVLPDGTTPDTLTWDAATGIVLNNTNRDSGTGANLQDAGFDSTLTDNTKSWTTNEHRGRICTVTGKGEYIVLSNTATVLTLRGDNGDNTNATYSIDDGPMITLSGGTLDAAIDRGHDAAIFYLDAGGNTLPTGMSEGYYFLTVIDAGSGLCMLTSELGSGEYNNRSTFDLAITYPTAAGSGTMTLHETQTLNQSLRQGAVGSEKQGQGYKGKAFTLSSTTDFTGLSFYYYIQTASGDIIDDVFITFIDSDGDFIRYKVMPAAFDALGGYLGLIDVENTDKEVYEFGTFNITAVTDVHIHMYRPWTTQAYPYDNDMLIGAIRDLQIIGGTSAEPADWPDVFNLLNTAITGTSGAQTVAQYVFYHGLFVGGDGTIETHFADSDLSVNLPAPSDGVSDFQYYTPNLAFGINGSASSDINLTNSQIGAAGAFPLTVNSGLAGTLEFNSNTLINATFTTQAGYHVDGILFIKGNGVTPNGANFTNCTFQNTQNANGAFELTAMGTIDNLTVVNCAVGISIAGTTAVSVEEITFTNNTTDIHFTATSGTIDVQLASGQSTPTYTTDGVTPNFLVPTSDFDVTSSESGSLIQVFTTTTQTILDSTTGTSLTYTHSGETVDLVVQKAGFIPYRETGIVLSGDVSRTVNLVADLNYDASHGLTYTTDASWSRSLNQLTVPTFGPTGQAVYSLMIDSFINEASLRNTAFCLQMNGPQSLIFIGGAEGATDGDIENLTQCGVEYRTVAGVEAAEWAGFSSSGVEAGSQPEFQQQDGGTVTDARTTGDVNELIKTYGDASHGNFDYRDTFDWKVQTNGYRQAEVDVLSAFGVSQLSPILYIINLAEVAITGLTLGDPAPSGLSITDDSASPVSWDAGDGAKDYSVTITDTGSNSGETILRWLNYNLSLDATFQGKDPFQWPEMVIDNGAAYETIRGTLHNTPDKTVGVRVIDGSGNPHPDSTRFQADDGTYGTPPVLADISITGMPTAGNAIRLQIRNETGETASAWASTTAYAAGDKVLRSTGVGTEQTGGLYFVATTAGTTGGTEPTWDTTVGNTTADGSVVWTCYAVLFYDADPASASYATTYTDGEQFASGDSVRVRFAELDTSTSFKTYETLITATASGFSTNVTEESDTVYASNAVDGSSAAVTAKFTADYTNDELDLDANQDFTLTEAYAYYCYELTSTQGMHSWWGAVTAIDVGNYRNNSSILSMYFDETAGFVKQTDSARWFRSDGARPALDPTTGGNGVEINWKNPVYVQAVGSAVLPSDVSDIADAVWDEARSGHTTSGSFGEHVKADITYVNGTQVTGDGQSGSEWGPA